MSCLTIIRLIAMAIIFGILLTSFDQMSDVYMIVQTHVFGGSTLGVVACKYCSMPERNTPMTNRLKTCQTCTKASGRLDGGLLCGANSRALDKLSYFQSTCETGNWSSNGDTTSYCQEGDNYDCCITSELQDHATRTSNQEEIELADNLLEIKRYKLGSSDCEISVIIGLQGESSICNIVFDNSTLKETLGSQCSNKMYVYDGSDFSNGTCHAESKCCVRSKKIKSFDCVESGKCGPFFANGEYQKYFDCCEKENKLHSSPRTFQRCGVTVCETHINYVKYSTAEVNSKETWASNFATIRGNSIGGALCTYLKNMSITMIVPIVLHWALVVQVWLKDVRTKRTSPITIILVILNVYSQYRLLCILINWYKHEDKLGKEIDDHDLKVSSLESIYEAMFQVHLVYSIIMETEGILPVDISGTAKIRFSDAADVWPLVCFSLGLISSAYGMSKYLLLSPIDKKPCAELCSLKFLGVIGLNLFYIMRIYCIENILYSYYQKYPSIFIPSGFDPNVIKPILPDHYRSFRPLFYLLPSSISIIINLWRLRQTDIDLLNTLKKNPQILVLSGFSPFMFEKIQRSECRNMQNKQCGLQVWTIGSIANAVYIGIAPAVCLIIAEFLRGVTSFDLSPEFGDWNRYASSSLNLLFNTSKANVWFCFIFILLAGPLMLYIFSDDSFKISNMCKKIKKMTRRKDQKIKSESIQLIQGRPRLLRSTSVDASFVPTVNINTRRNSFP